MFAMQALKYFFKTYYVVVQFKHDVCLCCDDREYSESE